MGIKQPFSSLTDYADNPLVSVTIACLIVVGGIGFLTWNDIRTNRWRFSKYRMQSKVILTVTGGLIVLPALYFFFLNFRKRQYRSVYCYPSSRRSRRELPDSILRI